jgi:hypothetical protein
MPLWRAQQRSPRCADHCTTTGEHLNSQVAVCSWSRPFQLPNAKGTAALAARSSQLVDVNAPIQAASSYSVLVIQTARDFSTRASTPVGWLVCCQITSCSCHLCVVCCAAPLPSAPAALWGLLRTEESEPRGPHSCLLISCSCSYGWTGQQSGSGLFDIARPALGVFASLDRF